MPSFKGLVARVLLRTARKQLPARPDRARDAALRAFLLFRLTGDLPSIAASAGTLAEAHYLLDENRMSRRYAAAAYRLYRRMGDEAAVGLVLALLAGASLRLGRLQASLKYAEHSYALAQKIGDIPLQAISLGNLGQTLMQLGRLEEARESVSHSIRLMVEHDLTRSRNYVVAINTLALLYMLLNQDDLARPLYELAAHLAREGGDATLLSLVNANLGLLCWRFRDWEGSVPYFQRSLEIARRHHDVRSEEFSLNLARALIESGRLEEAIGPLVWAGALARRGGNRELEWLVAVTESRLYEKQHRYGEALASAERAFALVTAFGCDEQRRGALHGLARVCILVRDLERAAALLEEAVRLEEATSRNLNTDALLMSMFEMQISAFEDLLWVQIELGRHEDALATAERGRARVLARGIASHAKETEAPPDFDEIRAIAARLDTTFLMVSLVREPTQHFDRDPDGYAITWAVPPDPSQPVAFHRSPSLREEFSSGEPAFSTIGERVQILQTGVSREDQRVMYDWFVAPVAHALPTDRRALVTVVPVGFIAVMPLAMACDADGVPLVEKHSISMAPSIQTLQLALNRERRGDGALVVGDPKTEDEEPLPFARAEAKSIAKRMKTTALIGDAATRGAVVEAMPGKRLLHFATHAEFSPEDAESDHGALLLTGGRLTAKEIRAMSLDADLVVLSTCNSGQGRIVADGVLGLSRSFLLAGAGSVLATLWEIPDEATQLLMDAFYECLAGHGDMALALREAMLHLRSIPQFAAPVNWSAFVLIGLPQHAARRNSSRRIEAITEHNNPYWSSS